MKTRHVKFTKDTAPAGDRFFIGAISKIVDADGLTVMPRVHPTDGIEMYDNADGHPLSGEELISKIIEKGE